MELFRWRLRNFLLVMVVVVVLIERGMAKTDKQLEDSSGGDGDSEDSAGQPAEHSDVSARADHGRPRHQRRERKPKPQHDHDHDDDHDDDHDHQHNHRKAQRGRHSSFHHKPHTQYQLDAGPEPLLPLLAQPHALSRSEDGDAHDLLDCEPQPGDKLLARSVVRAEFRPLGFAEASWFFPQNGRDQRTIHCVRVLDQRRDGYGGYPRLLRGGVGHHYAELNFKSDFSRGFHFVVEVYGQ